MERCARLLRDAHAAAALHGWSKSRHRHYATTDVPLWRIAASHPWVRLAIDSELHPAVGGVLGQHGFNLFWFGAVTLIGAIFI